MKILTSNQFGKLDVADLEKFEKVNDIRLPEEYRNFLIEHNGGRPEPNTVPLGTGATDVHYLYGMHEAASWANFFYHLDVYFGRIPNFYMPIGNDSFGNLFIMSLRDDNFGYVAFWSHEDELKEGDAGEYFENVFHLYSSFTDFVNSLYQFDYNNI